MTDTLMTRAPDAPELPRRLDDDVLQSAEEAVLAEPASAVLPGQGDLQPMPAGPVASAPVVRRTLGLRVAQQPFTAALLAFGAGAVAAALLRTAIQRRRARA